MTISMQKITRLEDMQEREIVEKLCYLLCGFDTQNIYLEDGVDGVSVVMDGMNEAYVMPFKYLILKVREYSNKEELVPFIEMYLKNISRWRKEVNKVEELYVKVNKFVGMFKELEQEITVRNEMEAVSGDKLNLLEQYMSTTGFDRNANGNNDGIGGNRDCMISTADNIFYLSTTERYKFISWICNSNLIGRYFEEKRHERTVANIEKWINYAEPTYVAEESTCDGFSMCPWKDKFRIKPIKGLDRLQLQMIEECGKIVYFLRNIFKIEIINDLPNLRVNKKGNRAERRDDTDKYIHCNNNINAWENDECGDGRGKFNAFDKDYGFSNVQLASINLTDNFFHKINLRNFELVSVFNDMLFFNISLECEILYDIIFFQEFSIHLDLFEEFHNVFLTTNNSVIFKIDHFLSDRIFRAFPDYTNYFSVHADIIGSESLVTCQLSDVLLSEYVFKLLHASFSMHANPHLTLLERFTYSLNSGFMSFFFSPKIFTEIKIISRFLFLINIILYYLEQAPKYNFTRKIYLIFMRIKNRKIEKMHKSHKSRDVVELLGQIENQVYDLLQTYYLTNAKVFVQISVLIEISLEYIQLEYKEHINGMVYEERIMTAINSLIEEIKVTSRDDYFVEFLQRF